MALADCLVRFEEKHSICLDCKNACGGCSWSAVDPATGRLRFEPVKGWVAEKTVLKIGRRGECSYRVKACPLFAQDDYRPSNNVMLTETESKDFLENIDTILRRWANDY